MILPEPQFQTIADSRRVRLIADWTIEIEEGLRIVVPAGFETDGASVPRLLWPVFPPWGVLFFGSIIHDFGYQHGYLLSPFNPRTVYPFAAVALRRDSKAQMKDTIPVFVGESRLFFDNLFRQITIARSGKVFEANMAYAALRMFGWIAWNKYRKRGPAAINGNSLWLPGI
jgi:hypothetical protein